MANILPPKDAFESFDAMRQYRNDKPGTHTAKVIAYVNGIEVFKDDVPVIVVEDNTYMRTDIFWEDINVSYKNLGLNATYGSSYYYASYDSITLTIKYQDADIIIKIS